MQWHCGSLWLPMLLLLVLPTLVLQPQHGFTQQPAPSPVQQTSTSEDLQISAAGRPRLQNALVFAWRAQQGLATVLAGTTHHTNSSSGSGLLSLVNTQLWARVVSRAVQHCLRSFKRKLSARDAHASKHSTAQHKAVQRSRHLEWPSKAQCPSCTPQACSALPWPVSHTTCLSQGCLVCSDASHQVATHPSQAPCTPAWPAPLRDAQQPRICPARPATSQAATQTTSQLGTQHVVHTGQCRAWAPLLPSCLAGPPPAPPALLLGSLPGSTCPSSLLFGMTSPAWVWHSAHTPVPPEHTPRDSPRVQQPSLAWLTVTHSITQLAARASAAVLSTASSMQLLSLLLCATSLSLMAHFMRTARQLRTQHVQHMQQVESKYQQALESSEAGRQAAWVMVAWQQAVAHHEQAVQAHRHKLVQQQVVAVQGQHDQDMHQLTQRLEAMTCVQDQLSQCQALVRQLAVQLDEARAELGLKDELLGEAHDELDQLGHEVMLLQAQLRTAEDQGRQHRQLMDQLQRSLQTAEEQLTCTQRAAEQAGEELDQVHSLAVKQQQELDRLQRDARDQENKVVWLTQQVAHAAGVVEEMRGCNEAELLQVQALRQQVHTYQQEVDLLTRELAASCEVTAECERELQALRQVRTTGLTWLIEAKDKELRVRDQHIKVLQEAAMQQTSESGCAQCKQQAALASSVVPDTPPVMRRIPSTRRTPNT